MSEVNSTLGNVYGPQAPQAQSFTRMLMGNMYIGEAEIEPPRYHVHLFTISTLEHVVQQPPLVPYLIIPACVPGEAFKKVVSLPHPMMQIERHPDKNEAIIYKHMAERVAQSICNPNNPSLDQDFVNRSPFGLGVDLNAKGVFWSRNEEPAKEELAKATKRMENYFRFLMERARTLGISNPKELEFLIDRDYHAAADYFGEEFPWHRRLRTTAECPQCGEPIKSATLAYHVNSAGIICVIDRERAIVALGEAAERSSRGKGAKGSELESPPPRKI